MNTNTKLTNETRKLIEGYKAIIVKNKDAEVSFNQLKKDFPSLVSETNKEEVIKLIKEIL